MLSRLARSFRSFLDPGPDAIVEELQRSLNKVPRDPTLKDAEAKKEKAIEKIRVAVRNLLAKYPDAFKEALESGDGTFIDLIRTTIKEGYGERLLELGAKDGKGIKIVTDADGFECAEYREGGVNQSKRILFIEEIPAVSFVFRRPTS